MPQVYPLTPEELDARMALNFRRLCEPYYQIDQVFAPAAYDWPGDKEGRALLAFMCHLRAAGRENPCLAPLLAALDDHTGEKGYFGPAAGQPIFEQQLSGHSWYLRGLCEAYEHFGDAALLQKLRRVFEGLYLPTAGRYGSYPIERPATGGEVSGHSALVQNGWLLSSDVGCAFMSIDGLSHYYAVTKDARALDLLEEMTAVFDGIDKVALKAQTHCSLTAARGMLRLYETTGEVRYLERGQRVWHTYLTSGMTDTYQNFNWWGRPDTWTEPCAIVDSLMVALQLYQLTADEGLLTLARRIWHNGMASAQRPNGGAGTDTTVYQGCDTLQAQMYEAPFCCTMRLAEGLRCAAEHASELAAVVDGTLTQDEKGRWHDGDLLYAEIQAPVPAGLAEMADARVVDGRTLTPLVKYYRLDEATATALRQRVRFPLPKKPAARA